MAPRVPPTQPGGQQARGFNISKLSWPWPRKLNSRFAAARLCLSQRGLSEQLHDLEREFGVRLFRRTVAAPGNTAGPRWRDTMPTLIFGQGIPPVGPKEPH
ncbi:helix-turn-helix domain-containing protein [Arthrobacter sp. SLBN-100]|uniref:helix-turn-helix domain-containing protein n=1 Tax=Arthrobacter sp. SLBN-100 TaxID=2768450 RepID=UPI00190F89AB